MRKTIILSLLATLCILLISSCASGSSFDFDAGASISKNKDLDTAGFLFGFHGRSMSSDFIGVDYNFDTIIDKKIATKGVNNQVDNVGATSAAGIGLSVGPAFRLFKLGERFAMFASPVFRISVQNMQKSDENMPDLKLFSVGGGLNLSSDFYLDSGLVLRIGFDIGAEWAELNYTKKEYEIYDEIYKDADLGARLVMYPKIGIGWYIPQEKPKAQSTRDNPTESNSVETNPLPRQSYITAPWYYRHTDLSGDTGNWAVLYDRDLFNELTGEVSLVYPLINPSYPHHESSIAITTREFTNKLVNSDGSITNQKVIVPDIRFRITNSATDEIRVIIRYELENGKREEYNFIGKDESSAIGRLFSLSEVVVTAVWIDAQREYDKYVRPIFDALADGRDVKIAIVDGYSRHSTFTIEAKGFTLGMKNVYPEMEYDTSFDVDVSR